MTKKWLLLHEASSCRALQSISLKFLFYSLSIKNIYQFCSIALLGELFLFNCMKGISAGVEETSVVY